MLLRLFTVEEIETEIFKGKKRKQDFPEVIEFPFSEQYKHIVTQITTTEISSETVLYHSVEAINENKGFDLFDYWCFGGNGQGDRWFLNKKDRVFFYDHDYDERLEPMYISFEQWLKMAFVIKQLDQSFDEFGLIPESVKQKFYETLNSIHPTLSENYPFSV